MKILKYVWTIIVNIITLFIACGVFSVANNSFESIVLAVLVLIYLSISSFSAVWALSHLEFVEALDNEFRGIRKLINTDKKADDEEFEKEAREVREKKKNTAMIKFYINIAFQCIIYLIALYNLVSVI